MARIDFEALDITLEPRDHVEFVDGNLIMFGKTDGGSPWAFRAVGEQGDRVAAALANNSELTRSVATLQEENRLLRAELERAQRLVPSADLATVVDDAGIHLVTDTTKAV